MLALDKLCKETVLLHELFITAFFHDMSFVQTEDTVTVLDRRKTVGDHEAGTVHFTDGIRDSLLCYIIKGAGGFIKEDNGRL